MTDKKKQIITRYLTTADDAMEQAEIHTKQAWTISQRNMRRGEMLHPGHTAFRFEYILLLLLLILPFFVDPFVEQQAISHLWTSWTQRESAPPLHFTFLVVLGQVGVVFMLAKFGKTLTEFHGLVLQGFGLLAALAIPVMAVATTLAQASVNSLLKGSAASWSETLAENMHLVAFAIFSMGIHGAIWALATKIGDAAEAVIVVASKRSREALIAREKAAAEQKEKEAEKIVVQTLLADEALSGRNEGEFEFQFRYITTHPKVEALIRKHHDPSPEEPLQEDSGEAQQEDGNNKKAFGQSA